MTRNQGGEWLRYDNPDDKLPWLEPAEDYERGRSPLRGKLIGGLVAVVAVVALLIGGMSWYLNRSTLPGALDGVDLIKAPGEPYKIPPSDPGGMVVDGQGDTVYAAGAGDDPGGIIDLDALPEEPITRSTPGVEADDVAVAALPPSTAAKPAPSAPATKPQAPVATAKPTVVAPAVPPKQVAIPAAKPVEAAPAATGNGTFGLQLGAFSSRARAESGWKSMSQRFAFIGALTKSIEPVGKGGSTLYRLRAVGIASRASAENLCSRMKVAGDSCAVVAP